MAGVKEILDSAFDSNTNLNTVNGGSILYIGVDAFAQCTNLTSLDLTKAVEIKKAFSGSGLTTAEITSMIEIADMAFFGCASLTTVTMPNVTEIGQGAFQSCVNLKNIDLSNVTSIASGAFEGSGLISVELPAGLTTVVNSLFLNCASLTTVTMPGVTTIENLAFRGCTSLESIDLSNVTSIGSHVFMDCENLSEVVIKGAVKGNSFEGAKIEKLVVVDITDLTAGGQLVSWAYSLAAEVKEIKIDTASPLDVTSLHTVDKMLSFSERATDISGLIGEDGVAISDPSSKKYLAVADGKWRSLVLQVPVGGVFDYDGNPHEGVPTNDGYELSGDISKTDAGNYTVTLTLKPDYAWEDNTTDAKDVSWKISKKAITVTPKSGQFKVYGDTEPENLEYDLDVGLVSGYEPDGKLGRALGDAAGDYAITKGDLDFGSNYEMTFTEGIMFTIKKKALPDAEDIADQTYAGEKIKPAIIIKDGDYELVEGTDFTVVYGDNINAGTGAGTATVTGEGNYTGNLDVVFNIVVAILVKPTADSTKFVYGGEQTYVPVGVTNLMSVTYDKRTDAGTQTVTVSLKDKANSQWDDGTTDDLTFEFTIARKSIEGFTAIIGEQAYTGSPIIPDFTFRDGDALLVKGVDYTVEATNNTDEGTANVTITGIGNYEGTTTATFEIAKEAPKSNNLLLYMAIVGILLIIVLIIVFLR